MRCGGEREHASLSHRSSIIYYKLRYRATLQSLDILSRAQSYLGVDPALVGAVKSWLKGQQAQDGGLSPCPLEAALDNNTELNLRVQATAETLATVISVGVETEVVQHNNNLSVLQRVN